MDIPMDILIGMCLPVRPRLLATGEPVGKLVGSWEGEGVGGSDVGTFKGSKNAGRLD